MAIRSKGNLHLCQVGKVDFSPAAPPVRLCQFAPASPPPRLRLRKSCANSPPLPPPRRRRVRRLRKSCANSPPPPLAYHRPRRASASAGRAYGTVVTGISSSSILCQAAATVDPDKPGASLHYLQQQQQQHHPPDA